MPDLFTNEPAATTTAPVTNPAPVTPDASNLFSDQLSTIQNPDGQQKYASVEEALKALQHSQTHITTQGSQISDKDSEIAQLKAQLAERASIEEVVGRLTPQQDPAPLAPQEPAVAGLTEEAVIALFQRQQTQQAAVTQADTNAKQVTDALVAKFGDKAQAAIQAKAAELGMTPQALGEMAKTNPALVLTAFGSVTTPQQAAPTTNSITISPITPTEQPLERPTKSLLSGSTSKEQADFMAKVKADVYKKFGVTTN